MPALTAIIQTHNDALRIARAIESLRPCDEVLVIDHGSSDETCRVAREFGARVIAASGSPTEGFLREARHDWFFRLLPTESLSETLEASLHEWKMEDKTRASPDMVYAVGITEETEGGWVTHTPEVRLTHRQRAASAAETCILEGHLLRLRLP